MEEKVDETIVKVCNWVQENLEAMNAYQESSVLPETISALAELVSARARIRDYLS